MGYEIADCILIPLLLVGLFFLVRSLFRLLRKCYQEVRDCFWIAWHGTLTPEQVREEFLDTMGREPTIAEAHDLHDMIQKEHQQAVRGLMLVGGGIVGLAAVLHRSLHD